MAGEQFTTDLRRNSVTWKLFDVAAFVNRNAMTVAELNTAVARLGIDITCALDEEATTFTLGSSEMDERLSFCDGVGTSRPSEVAPELALGFYRDKDRTATGVFKNTFDWLRHPDRQFILVQRVGDQDSGPKNGVAAAAFATTDHIRAMQFSTDFLVDTLANGDPVLGVQNPLSAGWVAWNVNPSA